MLLLHWPLLLLLLLVILLAARLCLPLDFQSHTAA
jgi:hypothetical protein